MQRFLSSTSTLCPFLFRGLPTKTEYWENGGTLISQVVLTSLDALQPQQAFASLIATLFGAGHCEMNQVN